MAEQKVRSSTMAGKLARLLFQHMERRAQEDGESVSELSADVYVRRLMTSMANEKFCAQVRDRIKELQGASLGDE